MAAEGARAAGSGDAEPSGKAVRSGQATSPRAAAAAAAAGSGGGAAAADPLAVPRAVALRQQQQAGESGGAPGQQDPAKRLRAVQKKLRQIEQVEEKQRRGMALTVGVLIGRLRVPVHLGQGPACYSFLAHC